MDNQRRIQNEPSETSKMELFVKIVDCIRGGFRVKKKLMTSFCKIDIIYITVITIIFDVIIVMIIVAFIINIVNVTIIVGYWSVII